MSWASIILGLVAGTSLINFFTEEETPRALYLLTFAVVVIAVTH